MATSKTTAKSAANKTAAPAKAAAKAPAAKAAKPAAAAKSPAAKAPAAARKTAATKPAPQRREVPPEQRRNYIEVAAYFIAERHGFTSGRELQDWQAAEAEIDRLLAAGLLNP